MLVMVRRWRGHATQRAVVMTGKDLFTVDAQSVVGAGYPAFPIRLRQTSHSGTFGSFDRVLGPGVTRLADDVEYRRGAEGERCMYRHVGS